MSRIINISLRISQTRFTSLVGIIKKGHLSENHYSHFLENEECKQFIFDPIIFPEEREIILHWEEKEEEIPGGLEIYDYFNSEGYELISKPHISDLINSMEELSEKKLAQFDIPDDVSIVLPVPGNYLLLNHDDFPCFPEIFRALGNRRFDLVDFRKKFNSRFAFLLKGKKKK
jgi:hypothetical protein